MADGPKLNPDDPLVIRAGDAQALLNYLSGQPCGQVYGLVTMLMNLAPLVDLTKTTAPAVPASAEPKPDVPPTPLAPEVVAEIPSE